MEYVRFGDLYSIPSSNGVSRPSAVRGEGYKMINMGELFSNDIIRDIPMERVKLSEKEKAKFLVKEGDLLFARQSLVASGAGKCSIVKELNEETTFESHLIRVRLDNSIVNPWYYYYLFQLPYNPVKTIVNQCAQAGIRGTELVKIKVPLPPIKVQNKVAETLSTYDDLIENNNKRIAILEQMAENLYKEWFVRFRFPCYETAEFENGLPKGWEIYQAQNLFNISIGRTPDRKQFDYFTTNKDDALWISISDMKDNMFITKSSEYLTDEAIKKVNMPMVEEDTVLLSFKLSVGRVSITTKQSCTNEAIAHFKTNDKELLEYTYLYLKLFNYQNLGNTSAIGNAVNSTIIKKMKFLLPNRELIQKFHNCTKDIFAQIKNVMNENENLIKQRDLLLPRLMSGKLEV